MPLVGQKAPNFEMLTTKDLDKLNVKVRLDDYRGKWLVLFFYPADFTFVCPTEILALNDRAEEFFDLDCEILGVSVDNVHSHKAWIKTPRDQNGLGELKFPLASDITKEVARAYDVLIREKGVALRGLFIIDPEGYLRYQVVHELNVGRSVDETLRVLEALQSGEMCGANWKPGDPVLQV